MHFICQHDCGVWKQRRKGRGRMRVWSVAFAYHWSIHAHALKLAELACSSPSAGDFIKVLLAIGLTYALSVIRPAHYVAMDHDRSMRHHQDSLDFQNTGPPTTPSIPTITMPRRANLIFILARIRNIHTSCSSPSTSVLAPLLSSWYIQYPLVSRTLIWYELSSSLTMHTSGYHFSSLEGSTWEGTSQFPLPYLPFLHNCFHYLKWFASDTLPLYLLFFFVLSFSYSFLHPLHPLLHSLLPYITLVMNVQHKHLLPFIILPPSIVKRPKDQSID